MMNEAAVVTGAGPVGWAVAEHLAGHGVEVRIVTRSGSGPERAGVSRVRADVSQPGALDSVLDGATALFHCTHGSVYDAEVWRRELLPTEQEVLASAGRAGVVVVFPESLYAYGRVDGPITEDTPRNASTGKLGVRTELLRAREASSTPTVSVVASDFYGPRVLLAHAGERMLTALTAGRTVRVVASADQVHSFTYVPDLAAAMVRAAEREGVWNSVLHAPTGPALTQRQMAEAYARAAGLPAPKVAAVPAWTMRAAGLVHRSTREFAETLYQFERPFVMDSTASEQRLGLTPTPLTDAAAATVAWWRTRP